MPVRQADRLLNSRESDRSSSPSVWVLIVLSAAWLVTVLSALGQSAVLVLAEAGGEIASQVIPTDFGVLLVSVVLVTFGALVVVRADTPAYGWLMVGTGLAHAIIAGAGHYALYAREADLPGVTGAVWIQDLWMVASMLALLLLPALFPDGRPVSSRLRKLIVMATVGWSCLIVAFVLAERPATNFFLLVDEPPANPTGVVAIPEMAINAAWLGLSLASVGIAIASLVTRWRVADQDLRQRFKWVLYAFGVLSFLAAVDLIRVGVEESAGVDLGVFVPTNLLVAGSMVGLAVALGFAVLRLGLYQVDLVINRTLVYGGLTLTVLAIYVGVVVGVGALLPVEETLAALTATGIVAVVFAPLRNKMQSWVNRLLYGQRHEPYAVLSEMGRLLSRSGTPRDTLQSLAETVAKSLKVTGAAIELEENGEWRRAASHGEIADAEDAGAVLVLHHQGELVGRMIVGPRPPKHGLSSADIDLLEGIAHQAGALVHSVRLTAALQRSRERLVQAREEERRRIRRDLHDEIGPTLASQTLQLDAVLEGLQADPAHAAELVSSLKEQTQLLVADIRRLVYELRPPALDELGVDGALAAHAWQLEHAGRLSIDVRTVPDPLPSLPAAVEVAAYRIAREAITNAVRHSGASQCVATLDVSGGWLTVVVADDGRGMQDHVRTGMGLISMRERTEELGGTLTVTSRPAGGTRIQSELPLSNGSLERVDVIRSGVVEESG